MPAAREADLPGPRIALALPPLAQEELEALPPTQSKSVVHTILGELSVPSYTYDGRLIWGFTYRILEELLVFVGLSA